MIKKLTPSDKEVFIQLSEEFYSTNAVLFPVPRSFHEDTFEELMRSDVYADCYLFEVEGKTVGFGLTAKTYSREAGGMVLWIEELYLQQNYRNLGLGKQFFQTMESYARENGFARIRLEVEEDNKKAISLYQRLGFEPLAYGQMIKELRPHNGDKQ